MPVEPLELSELASRGSLFVTRPSLMDYTKKREDLLASAEELFGVLRAGVVRCRIGRRWRLEQAREAHRALEARETSGASLLLP